MNDPDGLPAVRRWFAERTRLSPELLALPAFEESVRARMREIGVADEVRYAALLASDAKEAAAAHALVSVPETWLFRVRASFELLRERLALLRRSSETDAPLRLLSAGSAQGAEACSLVLTATAAGWPIERVAVDAVDLNPVAIAAGREGRLGSLALREETPSWTPPLITRSEHGVTVDRSVLERIRFIEGDLFLWAPEESTRYAAILCRNVLIYLARPARSALLARLLGWLAPEGLLILGHADAIGPPAPGFCSAGPPGAFAFERRAAPAVAAPAARRMSAPVVKPPSAPPPRRRTEPAPADVDAALALLATHRVDEAIALLDRLLRGRSDSIEALLLLGETRLARGERREAEAAFTKVVYLDEANERALVRLAELADAAGRREAADRFRDRALRAHLAGGGEI